MHSEKFFAAALTLVTLLSPAISMAQETAADADPDVNRAQRLVFMGDHLQQVGQGQTLIYGFTRRMPNLPDHQDEVRLTVLEVRDDSRRDLSVEFLSGPDRIDFPSAEGYRGNPVAIQFLERDVRDMAQATGTPSAYLRARIRKAFRNPEIDDNRVTVGDTEMDAVTITVTPFKTDKNLAPIAGYAEKEYRFVYSEAVPGDLVSIRTRMSDGSGEALIEELQYRGVATATPAATDIETETAAH